MQAQENKKIFLGSTVYDLKEIRTEINHFLNDCGLDTINFESGNFPVLQGYHSHDACIDSIANADMYLLIIGSRFGGRYSGTKYPAYGTYRGYEVSITWAETMFAYDHQIPVYTFVKKEIWDERLDYKDYKRRKTSYTPIHAQDNRIFEFIDFISHQKKDNWIESFTDIDDLKHEIVKVLHLSESYFDAYKKMLIEKIEKESWFYRYSPLKMAPITYTEFELVIDTKNEYEIIDIAEKFDNILVLGEPGAGKTTSLKMLALNYGNNAKFFPIFIDLGQYTVNLRTLIKNTVMGIDAINEKINKGGCLVIFDGLNEAGNKYEDVVKEINILSSKKMFKKNKYVVSCRNHNYKNDLRSFNLFEIQPISNYFIFKILKDKFGPGRAKEYYRQMDQKIKDLCRNPLMLTMLVYDLERRKVPAKNRAELFDKFIELFLEKWERGYTAKHAVNIKKILLSKLAYEMGPITSIDFDSAQKILVRCLTDLQEKHYAPTDYDITSVLAELQSNGLLKKSENMLSFFHQSVQEYFIAYHMYRENVLFDEYVADKNWTETLLFLSGFLEDSTQLAERFKKTDIIIAAKCVETARKINQDTVNDIIKSLIEHYKIQQQKQSELGFYYDLVSLIVDIHKKTKKPLEEFFIEVYFDKSEAYSILSLFWSEIDQHENSLAAAQKGYDNSKRNEFACFRLAIAYDNNSDYTNALKYYEEAYSINPRNKFICYNLGVYYLDRDPDKAKKFLEEAIRVDSCYPAANHVLGNLLKRQGKIDQAILRYKKAISCKPDYHKPYSQMGEIYSSQNKLEKAITCYTIAVKLSPDNAPYHKKLAELLEKQENFRDANIHWEIYLNIDPGVYDAEAVSKRIQTNKKKQKGLKDHD